MRRGVKRLLVALVLLASPAAAFAGSQPTDRPVSPEEEQTTADKAPAFWTSGRTSEKGAYRWRLLALGGVIAGGMGYFVVRTVRRANADRSKLAKAKVVRGS